MERGPFAKQLAKMKAVAKRFELRRPQPKSPEGDPYAPQRGDPNPDPIRPNHKSADQQKEELRTYCKNAGEMPMFYSQYPSDAPPGYFDRDHRKGRGR